MHPSRVSRLPYFAHAANANGREDFVGPETVTYRQGHGYWNNSTPQAPPDPVKRAIRTLTIPLPDRRRMIRIVRKGETCLTIP
jgi:hypothetical protein